MLRPILVATLVFGLVPGAALAAADADRELAEAGSLLVKKYCYACHGVKFNGSSTFNVADRDSLLEDRGAETYVVPGNLNDSTMWQRLESGEMPPESQPRPTDDEREIIRRWILAGAPKPERDKRALKRHDDILSDILIDLRELSETARPYQRYFTLTHLYNNNASVSDFDLRLYRAAFSKALNSLSWEPGIVVPEFIDAEQTIMRVDLRDVGWGPDDWQAIIERYPYGLKFNRVEDERIVELDRQVETLSGTPLAYVRADWFSVTATRPPLYHTLLDIPETDRELEQMLRVDVRRDFESNRLARAGFAESGVSTANRLLDRHHAVTGYYWKSYDFKAGNPSGNLFRFPLGPDFEHHPFEDLVFQQDGGEQIFSLPNGLQGYMLIDADGNRIDEGPIEVVRDLKETSGSPVVVNGISCMHCHQHGMIRFQDTIREGLAVFGAARAKVRELVPVAAEMQRLVDQDQTRFLAAIDAATGPMLRRDEDAGKSIREFAEPIGAIARFYQRDVSLEEAAFELGLADPNELKYAIKANARLRRLGLGPLASDNAIKRSEWENREFVTSPFQEVAREIERGTPFVVIGRSR